MDIKDGLGRAIGLAMAGKSPWGGKKPGDGPEPDKPEGEAPPATPDEPAAEKPPKGPRNPWLPPSEEPRRSASIEDIFRNRGPEDAARHEPRVLCPASGVRNWWEAAFSQLISLM